MGALDVRQPGTLAERPATGPGRTLGQKRKPQLRLALGYRDEERRGAPVKTDYFIPHGSDIALAKFTEVYGDKPRAVNIRLPGSLGGFLEIKHVAFAGGQTDGGGMLKAIGSTNFALEGTLGGPDRLTVFNVVESGETDRQGKPIPQIASEEIWIDDVSDPAAQKLGVYLQATVTFGIPDVLGFGDTAEIRSRGKETIDTLWAHAVDIYGQLGPRASLLLRPKLVLKESTMLTPRGHTAQVYVVDLYVPESMDEILSRARELDALMPAGPSAALYGSPPSPGGSAGLPSALIPAEGEAGQQAGTEAPPDVPAPGHAEPEPEPEPGPDPDADDIPFGNTPAGVIHGEPEPGPTKPPYEEALAEAAAQYVPPNGKYAAGGVEGPLTLGEIHAATGGDKLPWLVWALRNVTSPPEYVQALDLFARARAPEAWQKVTAEREARHA